MITHCLFIQLVIQVTYYPIKSIIIPLLLLLSFAKGFLPEVFSASFLPLPSLWSSTMELVESCTQLMSQTSVTCLLSDKCTQTYLCLHFHFLLLNKLVQDQGKMSSFFFSSTLSLLDSPPGFSFTLS